MLASWNVIGIYCDTNVGVIIPFYFSNCRLILYSVLALFLDCILSNKFISSTHHPCSHQSCKSARHMPHLLPRMRNYHWQSQSQFSSLWFFLFSPYPPFPLPHHIPLHLGWETVQGRYIFPPPWFIPCPLNPLSIFISQTLCSK